MNVSLVEYKKKEEEALVLKNFIKDFLSKKDIITLAYETLIETENKFRDQIKNIFEVNDKYLDVNKVLSNVHKNFSSCIKKLYWDSSQEICFYSNTALIKKINNNIYVKIGDFLASYNIDNDKIYCFNNNNKSYIDIQDKIYFSTNQCAFGNVFYTLTEKGPLEIYQNKKVFIIDYNDFLSISRDNESEKQNLSIKNNVISKFDYIDGELLNPYCGSYLSGLAIRNNLKQLAPEFKKIENKTYLHYNDLYKDLEDAYQMITLFNDKTGRKVLIKESEIKDSLFVVKNVLNKNGVPNNVSELKDLSYMLQFVMATHIVGNEFSNKHSPRKIISNNEITKLFESFEKNEPKIQQKIKNNQYE